MIEALYLHIPYCKQKCAYCSFYSTVPRQGIAVTDDGNDKLVNSFNSPNTPNSPNTSEHSLDTTTCADVQLYVDNLRSRIEELGKAGLLSHVETLYIGGGTPSLLSADQIAALLKSVQKSRGATQQGQLREITVEANPESLTSEFLDACKEQGVTRISLGVQSLYDAELAAVDRLARVEDNVRALDLLKNSAFSVSVDVMLGLPGQTRASLEQTIQTLLAYERVGHVSVYPLSLEPNTRLHERVEKGSVQLPSEDEQAALMEHAHELLTANGFHHYEVANYAKPGFEAQHNRAYWTGREYLGLGPSASSMVECPTYEQLSKRTPELPAASNFPAKVARIRFTESAKNTQLRDSPATQGQVTQAQAAQAPANQAQAIQAPASNLSYELEGLTYEQSVAEDLMLASRLANGLNEAIIARAQDALGAKKVTSVLHALCDQGLLHRPQCPKGRSAGGLFAPTHKGWLLGNVMFSRLWDLAPTTKTFTLSP